MTSIHLPDSVITWEAEETTDYKEYVSTFTVRAMVGSIVIFERLYMDDEDSFWGGYAHDMAEAKEKAADALGERLCRLLEEDS